MFIWLENPCRITIFILVNVTYKMQNTRPEIQVTGKCHREKNVFAGVKALYMKQNTLVLLCDYDIDKMNILK